MYCHNCGQYIEDDDVYCNHCGAKVITDPEEPEKARPVNNKGILIALAIVAIIAAGGLAGWGLFRVMDKPSENTEEASAKEKKEKKEEAAEAVEDESDDEPLFDEYDEKYDDEPEETAPTEDEKDTQAPAFTGHDGDVFPQSSDRLLSEGDVGVLTDYELRIAINEIYARNHYQFQNADMREYFSNKYWYTGLYPNQEDVRAKFNSTEEANVKLMEKERSRR